MAGFDEKCPFCGAEMECHRHWDYVMEYDRECQTCHKLVHISVTMTPEFSTSKPVCEKCGKAEIQVGHYCDDCKQEIEAHRAGVNQRGG